MKIKLKNEITYEINDGASIGRIEILVSEAAPIEEIVLAVTAKRNLDTVQFVNDEGETVGEYHNMKLTATCSIEKDAEKTIVVIGLAEKTEIEKRLEAVEDGQEIQDGAIGELAEVISEVAGGEA